MPLVQSHKHSRVTVAAAAIDAGFVAVQFSVVAGGANFAIHSAAVHVLLVSIQQPISAEFRASWAILATAIDPCFALVQDPVEIRGAGLAAAAAVHPLFSQQRIPLAVLARVAWLTNRTSAVHEFLLVVQNLVVAVLSDEVVVVQTTRQGDGRQANGQGSQNRRPKPVVKELGVLMCVILTARKIQLQHHGQPRVETRACP